MYPHTHTTPSHTHTHLTRHTLSHSHNIPSHTCVHSLSALFTALGKLWVWYLHSLKPAYDKKVSVSLLFDCELGTDTWFYAVRDVPTQEYGGVIVVERDCVRDVMV